MSDQHEAASELRDAAAGFIEAGRHAEALEALSEAGDADDPDGTLAALAGAAHYHLGQYAEAATHFERALTNDPGRRPWQEMLAQSRANAVAEVSVYVPDLSFFERDALLVEPVVPSGAMPATPMAASKIGLARHARIVVGNLVGSVASVLMGTLSRVVGRVAGYRDDIWTNWYRRPFVIGILTLAYMREKLNRNNLKSTYPAANLIGFQPRGQQPPPGVVHFRTADGSWNNLADPKEGAAGTRFPRNVANSVIRPETGDTLMTPNPREISRVLLARNGEMAEVPFLNLLAASWINFQNHDWVHHGEPLVNEVHEIPLAPDDPARKKYWQSKIFIGKTQADPTRMGDSEQTPATFINEVTHWWDGSQIYGSDQETVDRLRSGESGKLRLDDECKLPLDRRGIEQTGFTRSWWVGLSMLHTLFAREHNAICDMLATAHPDWDDTRLFNVARLINAAVMAKIHTVEWTPAILPNRGLDAALNANWYGLLTNLLRTGKDKKTVASINVRNPEMGGVVANPINKHGEPYGLTEEFVEVYRLHSLLPETIQVRGAADGEGRADDGAVREVPFVETRQAGSAKLTATTSMADLFYSFGVQHPGQLVLNNYPDFMRELSVPGNPVFDMAAVDILRARERGVPRYNEFRRQLGLNPIGTFSDLTDDAEQVRKLTEVYGDGPDAVEQLDLMVGTLSEQHRPTGFGFGETLFQIFILNATRRLQADRFYTDCYNEQTYTAEGLAWIDDSDFKAVILRHYPELASTGLGNIKNAFEPWDAGQRLDPERHPLREYDRTLKPDPWQGDAWR
ncbi:peroxidase family protein [Candidatus Poriferisodalis sp.]|uniref:peroxidase family protein n=1 Tax=Candidatus Poriferisodalis sp. TaxID=3101277 RepID=UPI003B026AC1